MGVKFYDATLVVISNNNGQVVPHFEQKKLNDNGTAVLPPLKIYSWRTSLAIQVLPIVVFDSLL
jgi:hypothetical protein